MNTAGRTRHQSLLWVQSILLRCGHAACFSFCFVELVALAIATAAHVPVLHCSCFVDWCHSMKSTSHELTAGLGREKELFLPGSCEQIHQKLGVLDRSGTAQTFQQCLCLSLGRDKLWFKIVERQQWRYRGDSAKKRAYSCLKPEVCYAIVFMPAQVPTFLQTCAHTDLPACMIHVCIL